ncbi:GntR family transcriptional regulator [Plastorhodobacter daqingensis]|uniref:GntR family transcriptional regulator n=1 Tax=Plastorhodobacter daqingensis TaxID=1387281 RepID=A0ABW2UQ56_9RHOB
MPVTTPHALPALAEMRPRTVTDQIFDLLYQRVIDLSLPPGTRLSEAEVAAQTGVSRQPVRDAFFRLSQLGFILIRPQRATTVTPISEQAVTQAYFIRAALEESVMREAARILTPEDHDRLETLIEEQRVTLEAGDHQQFHALDDRFHRDICTMAGLEFVWTLVKENKGHMDRARFLSLSFGAPRVIEEHRQILDALRRRDAEAAAAALRLHLSQIQSIIDRLKKDRPEMFETAADIP